MKLTKIKSIRLYGNSEYKAERARASLVHADARSYAHAEALDKNGEQGQALEQASVAAAKATIKGVGNPP